MSLGLRRITLLLLALTATSSVACSDGTTTTTTSGSGGDSTGGTGGSGGTTGIGGNTGGSTGGTGGTGGSGAGFPIECATLAPGPLAFVEVLTIFNGSEDLAFDGKGNLAAKKQGSILLADATGQTKTIASNIPTAYGLRYRPDGFLVVALPDNGKVIAVSPAGVVTDVATGLDAANGIYPDFDGNVWMTEIGAGRVSRINPDNSLDVIVSGPDADSANGVVLDARRQMLYYSNWGTGQVHRVDMRPGADPTPIEILEIVGSSLDGLVMDACGHLYVVDQGNSRLFRIRLDAAGDAVGPEELIAEFPENVANAQFGAGPGFDPHTLYVTGNPGKVYALVVGAPGAPVPVPP